MWVGHIEAGVFLTTADVAQHGRAALAYARLRLCRREHPSDQLVPTSKDNRAK